MAILFDTNLFLRLAESGSELREPVFRVIQRLHSEGEEICYTPQIVGEFWNVCTRPLRVRGGLNLTVEQTEKKVLVIEKYFRLLPDSLATFTQWRKLIKERSVAGVQVHDAKIVASMLCYNIDRLATFNVRDFKRYEMIDAVDPRDLS